MPTAAASFAVKAQGAARVARGVAELLTRVSKPSGGIVFASATPSAELSELAQSIAAIAERVPFLVVSGTGVLTERGEIEDQPAAAAIVWSGGRSEVLAVGGSSADEVGEALAQTLSDRAGRTAPTVL